MDTVDLNSINPSVQADAEEAAAVAVERLPLWLSEAEAQGLIGLCTGVPLQNRELEQTLMTRMSELMRAFWR